MFLTMAAFLLVVFLPLYAYADNATQTDWSGENGVYGPVIEWSNDFYSDTHVMCYTNQFDLVLQQSLRHRVSDQSSRFVRSADFNNDGYIDLLGTDWFANNINWYENTDGSGSSWISHSVSDNCRGPSSVCVADINGDGNMDVVGAAGHSDRITWWENSDTSPGIFWTEHTVDGYFHGAKSVYSADVNGDGNMDILGAAEGANDITWWENMDGSGTDWTEHVVDENFMNASIVYSIDINGDNYMDVLGTAFYGGEISWWENMDGSGTSWMKHIIEGDFGNVTSVYSTDINGDNQIDVIGASSSKGDITWWENIDGPGEIWTAHTVEEDFGVVSAYSTDINGDGYMDILGAAYGANNITWWENMNGSGNVWTEHIVDGEFNGARSVYSAYINGDEYLDILGASPDCGTVWWNLTEYRPDGSLESSVLDVQESPTWQTIDWTCTEPAGTSVALQVRASDNSSGFGEWSDTLTAPCSLSGLLTDQDRYFQYRVIMNTTISLSTPVVHDVTVEWSPYTGIKEEFETEILSFVLYGALPNPASENAVLVFSLPIDSRVELAVFDMNGRSVYKSSSDLPSGVHEVSVNDLACGVYLVRLISGEFSETTRFVVIE